MAGSGGLKGGIKAAPPSGATGVPPLEMARGLITIVFCCERVLKRSLVNVLEVAVIVNGLLDDPTFCEILTV